MFEGFSGRDALGRIDRQHLIDQIFGLRRYRIPFRRRILSQKLMALQLKKKRKKQSNSFKVGASTHVVSSGFDLCVQPVLVLIPERRVANQ